MRDYNSFEIWKLVAYKDFLQFFFFHHDIFSFGFQFLLFTHIYVEVFILKVPTFIGVDLDKCEVNFQGLVGSENFFFYCKVI